VGVEKLLEKAKTRFSLDDVQNGEVETVSVIAVDELSQLIDRHLEEQIATLKSKLNEAESKLASGDSDGAELERAAAEAAMEAEAAALEAKAAAELRAEEAEAKLAELEKNGAAGGADVEKLEKQIKDLEGEVEKLKAENAELKQKAEESPADEKVDEADHSRAARLAKALLEDVVAEDEDKAKAAIEKGTFRDDFAAAIKKAHATFNRRTSALVRGERDHWEEALDGLKG